MQLGSAHFDPFCLLCLQFYFRALGRIIRIIGFLVASFDKFRNVDNSRNQGRVIAREG